MFASKWDGSIDSMSHRILDPCLVLKVLMAIRSFDVYTFGPAMAETSMATSSQPPSIHVCVSSNQYLVDLPVVLFHFVDMFFDQARGIALEILDLSHGVRIPIWPKRLIDR